MMGSVRAARGTEAGLRILAGLRLCSAAAWADDSLVRVTIRPTFESLDSNRVNQRISSTEASRYHKRFDEFAIADRNGDGFVGRVELEYWLQSRRRLRIYYCKVN